jgi:hypothetical protein
VVGGATGGLASASDPISEQLVTNTHSLTRSLTHINFQNKETSVLTEIRSK